MKKIIFLGDSITDADHNFSQKREGEPSLGNGYVRQIADLLETKMPGKTDIRNGGHDGFTVQGLLRMLDYDCLSRRPDVVSILIGSNDAAVCMNTGRTPEMISFAENYRWDGYRRKQRPVLSAWAPLSFHSLWSTADGYRSFGKLRRRSEGSQGSTMPFSSLFTTC